MPLQPNDFPRRILLAVTGLSPQIVTETLYALAVAGEPAFVPTEIHLLTTAEGAERARLALLSSEPGWFHRLRADYQILPIAFTEAHIHLLVNEEGEALTDIRTPEDNRCAADFITEHVRQLTADPTSALHVSIAGGRKTMGFYLGYALSLYGRPQDRLSHVLVSEPFESSWEFFYPTPYPRVLATRDNKLADASTARVTLAEIPFVSLRHELPEALLKGQTSFSATVDAARTALEPANLILDFASSRVCAAGKVFSLPPAELALLAVFARRTNQGEPPLSAPPIGAPDPEWASRYLIELRVIKGKLADLDRAERALKKGMDGTYFSSRLSKLRRNLKKALGPTVTSYLIDDGGTRPYRYRLSIPPAAIHFDRLDEPKKKDHD
jgi:CRISPR-associated protein (TIGR02584 family)